MDPNTTTCIFTTPLASGRSCKIGFIFTPSAGGNRSAVFSIIDDTIAGLNTIQLSGLGTTSATLTRASISFASTNVGASSTAQVATLNNTGKAVMMILTDVRRRKLSRRETLSACPVCLHSDPSRQIDRDFRVLQQSVAAVRQAYNP
ncbi:hypothetical protein HDF16_002741 [Granulicella aggregans]|uniref:Uncharacterized protein n=1 Tax=Granulicella aggregans TaxID=474949 RepID=A0A7W7ZDT0_9BACT|nr:hypothetical protein [Granulicella aggregans]